MSEPIESQPEQAPPTTPSADLIEIKQIKSTVAKAEKAIRQLMSAAEANATAVSESRAAAAAELASTQTRAQEIAALLTTVNAEAVQVAADRKLVLEALTEIDKVGDQCSEFAQAALTDVETAKKLVTAGAEIIGRLEVIRDEAIKAQAAVAEKNAHIEDGLNHVHKVRAELETTFKAISDALTQATNDRSAVAAALKEVAALQASIAASNKTAEETLEVIGELRDAAQASATSTANLAKLAETTETRVAAYEKKLADALSQAADVQRQIDSLLLGATNAGLASAFDKRSLMFKSPEKFWQWVFIGSLAGLLGLAIWHAIAFGNLSQPPDWQQLARMMLFKLPFLIPLVWLAIHAARQASFAKQMEEEYAFKATTSMSFEGYRRQMAEVGSDLDAASPLAQLCNNTLKTIAAPPGYVYNKQRMDPTPGTAAAEIVAPIVDGVSKTLAAKLPDLRA